MIVYFDSFRFLAKANTVSINDYCNYSYNSDWPITIVLLNNKLNIESLIRSFIPLQNLLKIFYCDSSIITNEWFACLFIINISMIKIIHKFNSYRIVVANVLSKKMDALPTKAVLKLLDIIGLVY